MYRALYQSLIKLIKPSKPTAPHLIRGQIGESAAAQFLKKEAKLRVIARNWRHKKDELDIVCWDNDTLVFVEVKAQDASNPTSAYYRVGQKKKIAVKRAAKAFVSQMRHKPKHLRFDVIAVKFCQDNQTSIHHYRNVSLFNKHFIP